jgi:hypothetical protein
VTFGNSEIGHRSDLDVTVLTYYDIKNFSRANFMSCNPRSMILATHLQVIMEDWHSIACCSGRTCITFL